MSFEKGDSVEVHSNQEGFVGSYFAAKIVMPMGKNKYLVEYQTLVTDDDKKQMLQEIVNAREIRPTPPEILVPRFYLLDTVDVLDNDGWWVGSVHFRPTVKEYSVYFESTGEEIDYPYHNMRLHQEWENGKWYPSPRHNVV
ncbi:hypothetical protein IFM89_028547 [Coptis chinensis]|uniref:Agenet domain-containing protein n=1 Tax=Coptis chinensis TaxID=261450 RepID=A0A835IDZ9_9MAGN|nr:hypothetical protein IFM89_028547 [Coptis chinensis]